MERIKVVIVGSGPAGLSTAMSLRKVRPAVVSDMVVLDKAVHPRHKLCGGGVTFTANPTLDYIGASIDSLHIPNLRIDRVRVRYQDKSADLNFPGAFRTVRRNEFDAALVGRAREQGIEVREGVAVRNITPHADGGMIVETSDGCILADVLVGADGAKSRIRRAMNLPGPSRVSRLIEVLTPESPDECPLMHEQRAVFDFTPFDSKVQGYYWDFPSVKDGTFFMNRGVFDSRVLPDAERADLRSSLSDAMTTRGRHLEDYPMEGHPERWYDPEATYSAPHTILVGDAAGVEPLLGEGIAYALMYGPFAARMIDDAIQREDFSFSTYEARLRASPLGRSMAHRTRMARWCYARPAGFFLKVWPVVNLGSRYLAWKSKGALPSFN